MLVAISTWLSSDAFGAVFWASIAVMVALGIQLYVKPYSSSYINLMEITTLAAVLITQLFSMLYWHSPSHETLITIVLVAINLGTLLWLVFGIVKDVVLKLVTRKRGKSITRAPAAPRKSVAMPQWLAGDLKAADIKATSGTAVAKWTGNPLLRVTPSVDVKSRK